MDAPAIVNAYVESKTSKLVLLRRDGDELIVSKQSAEYVSYHRTSDLTPEKLRLLRRDDGLRGDRMEGEWYRVQWHNFLARKMALQDDGVLARLDLPHYEADVHPIRRYLVDSGARVQKPRRAFLDIETDSRLSFAKLRAGQGRVLCWTVVDEAARVYTGCLKADFDGAERQLLVDLLDVLDGFDQVVAWNGDGFDFPVLKGDNHRDSRTQGRFRHLGINVDTKRWLWIDHLALYKRMNLQTARSGDEKQSYRLQDIATAVLHDGKEAFDGSKTWDAWLCTDSTARYNRDALVRYNVKDTDLLRRIEEKTGFLALLDTICDCCGTLPDTRGMRPLNQLDPFMLRLGLARGMHFPTVTRFESDDDKKKFAGAYVQAPSVKGLMRDVHVCDYKSLYPSIIISWNMSPETKVPDSRGSTGPIPSGFTRAPGTGVMFRTDVQGLLPAAVSELLGLRAEWKKKKAAAAPGTPEAADADRRSNAYKVAGNSFFGGTGNEFSRFFDVDVAESVTQAGVCLIHAVDEAVVAMGWESVYADSITGDRTVVVRAPDGRTHVLPVEQLWTFASNVRNVDKDRGLLHEWYALARSEQGIEGWFPIAGIIRHRVKKNLWLISTKDGQTEVTADHGIMLGKCSVSPAEFVKSRGSFEIVRAQPSMRAGRLIDLWSCIGSKIVMGEESSTRTGRVGGRPRVAEMIRRFQLVGDSKIRLVSHTGREGGKVCEQYPERIHRWFEPGSQELHALLRILAAYIAEGSAMIAGLTTKVGSYLSIAQNDPAWLESLREDLAKCVDDLGEVSVKRTGGKTHALRVHSNAMSMFFGALAGIGSRGKFLPSFIYDLGRDDFMVFWRKLIEGDGCTEKMILRSKPKKHGKKANPEERWLYTSNSQTLIAGLSYALDQHGIQHSLSYRPSKRAWNIRTRPSGSQRKSRIIHVEQRWSDGYVYDLSVDGAHTFVDGLGRVLLHNTDGDYVRGNPDRSVFAAFVKDKLNGEVIPRVLRDHSCSVQTVSIAYEKQFDRICFTGVKKRYFGKFLHYEGTEPLLDSEPEIKGLEFKRGDANQITRRLQERVIRMFLGEWDPSCAGCGQMCKHGPDDKAPKGRATAWLWACPACGPRSDGDLKFARHTEDPGDFSALIAKARDYVLLTKKLPLEFVTVSKSIQQAIEDYVVKTKLDGTPAAQPPHVTVAKMLAERGEEVSIGTKIAYVVVYGGDDGPTRAIPASDYVGDCDRFYLWDNLIWPPIERVLDAALPGTPWRRMFGRTRPAKEKPPKRGGAAPGQLGFFGNHVPAVDAPASTLLPLPPRPDGAPSVPAMRSSTAIYPIRLPATATRELMVAVREACLRYPGSRPVQVEIEGVGPHGFIVELSSDLRVAGKPGLMAELRALIDGPRYDGR